MVGGRERGRCVRQAEAGVFGDQTNFGRFRRGVEISGDHGGQAFAFIGAGEGLEHLHGGEHPGLCACVIGVDVQEAEGFAAGYGHEDCGAEGSRADALISAVGCARDMRGHRQDFCGQLF